MSITPPSPPPPQAPSNPPACTPPPPPIPNPLSAPPSVDPVTKLLSHDEAFLESYRRLCEYAGADIISYMRELEDEQVEVRHNSRDNAINVKTIDIYLVY